MNAAVLFDLDDTLVDTHHLRTYRDTQQWTELTDSILGQVQPFTGVTELLGNLRMNACGIAVVTTSPKWYAEKLLKRLSLPFDVIVAAGDTRYGKPSRDPSKLALQKLGHSDQNTSFVIGDRCVDIASGDSVCKWTIGAGWGTKNRRDLMMAYPKVIAEDPSEVFSVVNGVLSGNEPQEYAWADKTTAERWIDSPVWDRRKHLTDYRIPYKFARVYRKWGSWTDESVRLFKSKNPKQWWFKDKAASLFALELQDVIPDGGYVMFVPPAALKGTDGYDNRWELVEQFLGDEAKKKGWKFCQAVIPTESSVPAHEQEADSADRDPEVIKSRLRWVGGIPADATDVVIVDDVLTTGAHLRAYHDVVTANLPKTRISLVAWAVFSSIPWHRCPSANC
jgi:HAD superfamily hydrolase (TIGR01549 family)